MAAKTQSLELKVVGGPHNGIERYRVTDPVSGARIGGQVAYIRTALRYKRFVGPLGRRWGKTTLRPFLWSIHAAITAGQFNAGFLTSTHVKAWEMFQFCKDQFGGLVKNSVGEPESQNRYIDLHAINADPKELGISERDPVLWPLVQKNIGKNTGSRIYFCTGQYPSVRAVQGFPFKFDRWSIDEAQQQHPMVTKIVNPMLLDSGGWLDVSGIPDLDDIGNVWFEDYFHRAEEEGKKHRWASLNFPTYGNPHLDPEAMREIEDDCLTNDDYEQYILARFISGSGAVFTNLPVVFCLTPSWKREQPSVVDGPEWWKAIYAAHRSDLIRAWIYEVGPRDGESYAMTVDFAGRTRTRDATVIDVFNMTRNEEQVFTTSIRGMTSPHQLAWIEGIKDHYGAHEVHGDETPEGAALMGYLRERYKTGVIGHKFSSSNKAEYVKRGQFLFEMGEVKMIDCAEQKKEFKDYKRIAGESTAGRDQAVTYSHPPGKHDDFVSAFLQIAPSMAHGRREREESAKPPVQLLDEAGSLNLDFLNAEMDEEREDDRDNVNVRTRR